MLESCRSLNWDNRSQLNPGRVDLGARDFKIWLFIIIRYGWGCTTPLCNFMFIPVVPLPGSWDPEYSHSCPIISWLDYCNMLYMGLLLKIIWKLQLVQNVAANRVLGALGWHIKNHCCMSCIGYQFASGSSSRYWLLSLNPIWNVSMCLRNCLTQMGLACPHLCQTVDQTLWNTLTPDVRTALNTLLSELKYLWMCFISNYIPSYIWYQFELKLDWFTVNPIDLNPFWPNQFASEFSNIQYLKLSYHHSNCRIVHCIRLSPRIPIPLEKLSWKMQKTALKRNRWESTTGRLDVYTHTHLVTSQHTYNMGNIFLLQERVINFDYT